MAKKQGEAIQIKDKKKTGNSNKAEAIASPYDSAFHTIMQDCPKLILPVINEVFRENYSWNEKIIFHN